LIIVDVNLLLYATISSYKEHAVSRQWFEGVLNGSEQVMLPTVSLFGFVRISTNPRTYVKPLSVDEALASVESWLQPSHVHVLVPGPRHVQVAFELLRDLGTAANLTTDVQLAAHAIENQATLCSNDSDFARFPGLRWENPLRP
jgi:toxin-antitoxin system PIN domain toxin